MVSWKVGRLFLCYSRLNMRLDDFSLPGFLLQFDVFCSNTCDCEAFFRYLWRLSRKSIKVSWLAFLI